MDYVSIFEVLKLFQVVCLNCISMAFFFSGFSVVVATKSKEDLKNPISRKSEVRSNRYF